MMEVVRKTNDEALSCRISAVSLGYFDDPFVNLFSPSNLPKASNVARKSPLINRGTFIRTKSIDYHVKENFLSLERKGRNKQIISIGAGSDSRFFRLLSEIRKNCCKYIEIDFTENTCKKARLIYKNSKLLECLENPSLNAGGSEIISKDYLLLAGDLNDPKTLEKIESSIDTRFPTLILSECVLSYLPLTTVQRILTFATSFDPNNHFYFLAYEMSNPEDSFGQVMLRNLKARGLDLAQSILSIAKMVDLFSSFYPKASVQIDSMLKVYNSLVSPEEHSRLNNIEFMDEWEEWDLILNHYCLIFASPILKNQ